jgi:hypothetical protein
MNNDGAIPRLLLCLSSRTHQLPARFLDSTESGGYASDVQRGGLPLLRFGKREQITEKFRRAYAALLGTTVALRLLSFSLLSVAMDGGSSI